MTITVEIEGVGRVELDDTFRSLSPERQNEVIQGIIGTVGQKKPDQMQATRDRIAQARAGTLQASPDSLARAADANRIAEDQMTLSGVPTAARLGIKAVQGLPFAGEYFDEAMGKIGGEGVQQDLRNIQGAMDRQYPGTSTAAMIGGGVLGSIPMAIGAATMAPGAAVAGGGGLIAKSAAAGLAGAAVGGIEGAVSGYGAGNDGDRVSSARDRGMIGAAFGGALGAAAPAVSSGLRNLFQRFKGRDVSAISRQFGVSDDAARTVKAFLEADDFQSAAATLRQAGDDAMLADAGPNARALLDLTIQTGGTGRKVARDAIEGRAAAANPRLNRTLDLLLGPPEGVRAASRDISQRTAAIRDAAYKKAYSTDINYARPEGLKIEEVLDRVPPRVLAKAVQEADEAMIAAGRQNLQIKANIGPDGKVTFEQMPNVEQLDYIKRALSEIAQGETDAVTGRITGAGVRANKLSAELRDALGNAAPAYRTATKLGGDKIAEQNAFDMGRKLLQTGTTREMVRDQMANASREAKAEARRGLRAYIDESLASVQRTMGGTDSQIREAQQLLRQLSSRGNRDKLRAVMGDVTSDRLFKALDEAATQFDTRAAVAAGSQTYGRTEGKRMVEEITRPRAREAIASLANLKPGDAFGEIRRALTEPGSDLQRARMQTIMGEVADLLTRQRGPQAEAALRSIESAMAGQPLRDAEATRLARYLVGSGVLGGYQSGTRSPTMR